MANKRTTKINNPNNSSKDNLENREIVDSVWTATGRIHAGFSILAKMVGQNIDAINRIIVIGKDVDILTQEMLITNFPLITPIKKIITGFNSKLQIIRDRTLIYKYIQQWDKQLTCG